MTLVFQTPFGQALTATTSGDTITLQSSNLGDAFAREITFSGTVSSATIIDTTGDFRPPTIALDGGNLRLQFANARADRFDYNDTLEIAYTGNITGASAHIAALPDGSSIKIDAIPEPGIALMLVSASILILRRTRK
jgi:hypothetical protein